MLILLPDLYVIVPYGKISSILLCVIALIRLSASVCCVGNNIPPIRGDIG
jgi:hypothetical protein